MRATLGILVATLAVGATACGGGAGANVQGFSPEKPRVQAKRLPDGSLDDRSRCDWRGKADRESSEIAGPGSIQPNVRRVYQIVGTGDDRHKILVCREIDTNFDSVKDVVRTYNDKGESLHEEADADYDGRVDTWITFNKGRLAEVRVDTNHDGNADEWKYYSNGKLSRIKRDQNNDGKPDAWEIYRDGELERMGVDIDGDEHVDRWDHDNELRRRFDEEERKKEEAAAAAAAKKAQDQKEATDKAIAEDDAKAEADKKPGAKKPAAKKAP